MGLIDNIKWLFSDNNIRMGLKTREVETQAVIDEMITKYGEVETTVSDIAKINEEMLKKRKEMIDHSKSIPSGSIRCKSAEDKYYSRKAELRSERDVLNKLYKKIVTVEINKFPLNKPCTMSYIANHVGIKDDAIIWDILISNDIGMVNPYMYYDGSRYSMDITYISDSEITIRSILSDDYNCNYRYGDTNNSHKIILSNWRFVKSKDSSVFYVERTS